MKRLTVAMGAASGAIPVVFAASCTGLARNDSASAACDEAVVRTIGRGYTGLLHGLDAMVTAPFGMHPQWASIACVGLLAVATFALAHRLTRDLAPGVLGLVIALCGAAMATLTFPAQYEATLTFGNVLGAVLVVLPLVLASAGAPGAVVCAAVGLACSYDVPVALGAVLSVGVLLLTRALRLRLAALPWVLVAAIPMAWMAWRRSAAPEASLEVAALAGALGEGARTVPRSALLTLARSELGVVALAFAAVGAVSALRTRTTRPLAGALVAIIAAAAIATAAGAPTGPVRYGSALLAAFAATSVLAACGMAAVVALVAKANVPFARASAAMIVLFELAVWVRIADDTSLVMTKAPRDVTAAWNSRVFGDLPHDSVLLLPSARLLLRARAAAATGALRPDVIVVPTFGFGSRRASHVLTREPLLGPVVRDLALYGAPEEFSLSQLAAARPLIVAFDTRWDKLFARHLLPHAAFDRYFVEPHGGSDRLKAFPSIDEPTMQRIALSPPLADATHDLLRARAMGAAATGEREYADATMAELRRIAPTDTLMVELGRASAPKGALESRGLANRLPH